jgi:hypothetical protein
MKQQQALLFLKKKQQKNFCYSGATHVKAAAHQVNKSSLVLFFKKERLSSLQGF